MDLETWQRNDPASNNLCCAREVVLGLQTRFPVSENSYSLRDSELTAWFARVERRDGFGSTSPPNYGGP